MEIKKKSPDGKKPEGPSVADLLKAIEAIAAVKSKPGDRGEKGDKGDQGFRGEKGDSGERGEKGIQGEKGEKGESVTGPQGEKGERGEQGPQGAIGKQGPRGPVGKAGADGRGIESIEQPNPDIFVIHFTDGGRSVIELPRGRDGREIELRANGTMLQWRYRGDDDDDWRDLIDLKTFAGLQQQIGAGPVRLKLVNLTDVDTTNLTDTYVLAWDEASKKFIFVPNGSGGGGTIWRDGSGPPSNGLGVDGDYYLDVDTGDVYKKTAGTYSIVGNIQGPQGPAGANGTNGTNGTDGSVWHNGTGAPAGGLGVDGDYYLNNANGDVYWKQAGVWAVITNITGPTGATGATGAPGADGVSTIAQTIFTNQDGQLTSSDPALFVWHITTAGPWTADLPQSPNDGEWFIIANQGVFTLQLSNDSNADAATNLFDGSNLLTTGIVPGASYICVFDSATSGWLCAQLSQPHKYIKNSYLNITSKNNVSNPTTQVDTTISEIVLNDTAGNQIKSASVSYTLNAATTGAGGLDTGALANSTWYYEFVIAQADGTISSLLSTSRDNPIMPSGYIYKAFVGPRRTGGSANIMNFIQYNDVFFYQGRQRFLTSGNATTETSLSLSSFIPTIATEFDVTENSTITASAGGAVNAQIEWRYVSGQAFFLAQQVLSSLGASLASVPIHHGPVALFPNINETIYYFFTVTTGSSQVVSAYISRFKFKMY